MGTQSEEPITEEVEDLEQRSPETYEAVCVRVDGPVQTQALPSRIATMRSISLTTAAEPIIGKDLRRSRLVLLSLDQEIYVGTSKSAVAAGTSARWNADLPLELHHSEAVYARSAHATDPTTLTLIAENWAD